MKAIEFMKNSYVDIWNDLHKNFVQNNKPKDDEWLDGFEIKQDKLYKSDFDLLLEKTQGND